MIQNTAAESFERCLSDLRNYPHKALAPYEEFRVGAHTYYFTSGGSLYRKDPGTEEVEAVFYGCLTDESWQRRKSRNDEEL